MKKLIIFLLFFTNILFSQSNLEKVSLQLHWKYQFEFAGFIAALEKGYYKQAGLDVELKEYQFGQNIIEDILKNKSNYGIYNSNILLESINKKPLNLISSYFKRSALVLITKPEIRYPKDLLGKKIMAAGQEDFDLNFNYIFSLQNINTKNLNLIPHTFNVQDFADNKVDAMTAFISDQPYKLDKLGVKYNIINPSDFGIFNLQLELFTSVHESIEYRERTQRFKEASNKGWEYALNNPDEIIDIILKKYNSQNLSKDFLENEALYTQRLIMPKMYDIGSIDEMFLYRQIDVLTKENYTLKQKQDLIENFIFYSQEELDNIKLELNYSILQKLIPLSLIILIAIFYRQKLLSKYNEKLMEEVKKKTNEYKEQNEELKNSNKNFSALIDTAIETIAIFDNKYNLVKINQSGLNMLKIKEDYKAQDIHLTNFIDEIDLKEFERNLNNSKYIPYEIEIKNLANKNFPALISGKKIIRNAQYFTIVTFVDLTQIKMRDKFIQEQSKLAQMGELLNMIAHQWRQPLTAISASTEYVKLKSMIGDLNPNEVAKAMDEVYTYTSHLSKTINDFRDFYKEDKEKKETCLEKLVEKSLNIIEDSLTYQNIKINKELTCDETFKTFENEVTQVILTILQNAEEVLINNEIENPQINIKTYKDENDYLNLSIEDNGGGIPKSVLNKIFDPYFSTKTEKNGTGLGLYFAKRIIEINCDGILTASNNENGAVFTLKFKK